jgi:hypothetical protein
MHEKLIFAWTLKKLKGLIYVDFARTDIQQEFHYSDTKVLH